MSRAKELRALTFQSIYYSLVYLNTMIWPVLVLIVALFLYNAGPTRIITIVLAWMFYPLQGFLNFFVFTRPQARVWRERCPDMSSITINMNIFRGISPPPPTVPTSITAGSVTQPFDRQLTQDTLREASSSSTKSTET